MFLIGEILRLVHLRRQLQLFPALLLRFIHCDPAMIFKAFLLEKKEIITVILDYLRTEDISLKVFSIKLFWIGLGTKIRALEVVEV